MEHGGERALIRQGTMPIGSKRSVQDEGVKFGGWSAETNTGIAFLFFTVSPISRSRQTKRDSRTADGGARDVPATIRRIPLVRNVSSLPDFMIAQLTALIASGRFFLRSNRFSDTTGPGGKNQRQRQELNFPRLAGQAPLFVHRLPSTLPPVLSIVPSSCHPSVGSTAALRR